MVLPPMIAQYKALQIRTRLLSVEEELRVVLSKIRPRISQIRKGNKPSVTLKINERQSRTRTGRRAAGRREYTGYLGRGTRVNLGRGTRATSGVSTRVYLGVSTVFRLECQNLHNIRQAASGDPVEGEARFIGSVSSDSQPGFRGTLGFRRPSPGVPRETYFPSLSSDTYDWVRNPFTEFSPSTENLLSLQEEEELSELQCDRTLHGLPRAWVHGFLGVSTRLLGREYTGYLRREYTGSLLGVSNHWEPLPRREYTGYLGRGTRVTSAIQITGSVQRGTRECLISGIPFALHIKNMRIFTIVPTATSAHYGTLPPCLVTTT
ncbi:hypothetical protein GWK47_038584 [Chionoecetes opilio]|uniref:Uncharacterized protein n=1 Tax=Chionoecetes opilio TaxID=41210 RepID=A0A8J4YF90_CHIOP|nr:hypothetical protein GWK47_038584 [Chionoecetes opilio]